jgi:hypothetical protein
VQPEQPAAVVAAKIRGRQDTGGDMLSRHDAAVIWQYQQQADTRIVFANKNNKKKIVILFKGLPQLNCPEGMTEAGQRVRLGRDDLPGMSPIEKWFGRETLPDRLARALAARRAIDMKEFCESFEFFTHIRRKKFGIASNSQHSVADLCCGHGLHRDPVRRVRAQR